MKRQNLLLYYCNTKYIIRVDLIVKIEIVIGI